MFSGPHALRDIIENAELYPIRGLFQFSDYFPEIDAYYNRTLGFEYGASTGWTALNEIYNVRPEFSFFPFPLNLHFLNLFSWGIYLISGYEILCRMRIFFEKLYL